MDNFKGAALMTLAMLGFALEDMLIKLMAGVLPVGQIIATLGVGGAVLFGVLCRWQDGALVTRKMATRVILMRNAAELLATLSFVTALALTPLSTASAILQATPLVVTLGAALFLGETVGLRRWSAIIAGFLGVMLVLRPGAATFDPALLFAVVAVFGLAVRDLATRQVPRETSSLQLSFLAFLTLIPAGALLMWGMGSAPVMPDADLWLLIAGSILLAGLAYYAVVAAMRVGDVGFVTPFRYSRILFALVIGVLVFGERPDALTLIGAAVIVGSGLYSLWRERRRA